MRTALPRTLMEAWPDRYSWADRRVVRAFLDTPTPAEACTEIGADQPTPKALTVTWWQRIHRALRLRRLTRKPKL